MRTRAGFSVFPTKTFGESTIVLLPDTVQVYCRTITVAPLKTFGFTTKRRSQAKPWTTNERTVL